MKGETSTSVLLGLLYISITVVIVAAILLSSQQKSTNSMSVSFGDTVISVEVADTPALQTKGLSGRESLAPNEGMFFAFSEEGTHGFWMKDMRFALDIAWLDSSYHIVDIREHLDPSSYPEVFTPSTVTQYVLEVSAGFFEEHHIKVGDVLQIIR